MLIIRALENCHICNSKRLILLNGIYLNDGQFIEFAQLCKNCKTIHYIDDGTIDYEFKLNNCYIEESRDFEERCGLF